MKITALAGGVGGAKLLVGLARVAGPDLTAIVNTGDDARIYGLHVSPDIDIVTYWLGGVADFERGWGLAGDTFRVLDGLRALGADAWFSLGDRDMATCAYRTQRFAEGAPLSQVTDEIRRSFAVAARVIPMSDDRVRTRITTADGRILEFQEYFVREGSHPEVAEISFDGIDRARPGPGVVAAISSADTVVLCPSNPLLSIGPILALPGLRHALREHHDVVAVTPIVKGAALKGPADRLLRQLGYGSSASGVARIYADFCDRFVVDASDPDELEKVEALGITTIAVDTVMRDHGASERLARSLLA